MILGENHFKSVEESEMLFYKKHWLEAEIALSTVKFQLAQMKLEVENDKLKLKGQKLIPGEVYFVAHFFLSNLSH